MYFYQKNVSFKFLSLFSLIPKNILDTNAYFAPSKSKKSEFINSLVTDEGATLNSAIQILEKTLPRRSKMLIVAKINNLYCLLIKLAQDADDQMALRSISSKIYGILKTYT